MNWLSRSNRSNCRCAVLKTSCVKCFVPELYRSRTATEPGAIEQSEGDQAPGPSNHVLGLQDFLRGHFGAKIDIRQKKNNAGQIVIHFANSDDFERIVGRLRNAG